MKDERLIPDKIRENRKFSRGPAGVALTDLYNGNEFGLTRPTPFTPRLPQ